jgi:uncharacterized protein with PIN domain
VKLLVDEDGSGWTRDAAGDASTVATSVVSYVEARAALTRMRAGRRIDVGQLRMARRVLDDIWLDVLSVPSDDPLLNRAAAREGLSLP